MVVPPENNTTIEPEISVSCPALAPLAGRPGLSAVVHEAGFWPSDISFTP